MPLHKKIIVLLISLCIVGCAGSKKNTKEPCLIDEDTKEILVDLGRSYFKDDSIYEISVGNKHIIVDTVSYFQSYILDFFEIEKSELQNLNSSGPTLWCGITSKQIKFTTKRNRMAKWYRRGRYNVKYISLPFFNSSKDKAVIIYTQFSGEAFISLEKENEV